MALRSTFLLLSLFVVVVNAHSLPPKLFNVSKYGAVPDGKTDNSRAFLKAWKDACAYGGRSRVLIPRGTFMVGEVSFQGTYNGTMAFLVQGTLRAPTDRRNMFSDTWIAFKYGDYLMVSDCRRNSNCKPLPVVSEF